MYNSIVLAVMALSPAQEPSKPVVSQEKIQPKASYVVTVENAYQRCINDRIDFYISGGKAKGRKVVVYGDVNNSQMQVADQITVSVSSGICYVGKEQVQADPSATESVISKKDQAYDDEAFRKDLAACGARRNSALEILGEVLPKD